MTSFKQALGFTLCTLPATKENRQRHVDRDLMVTTKETIPPQNDKQLARRLFICSPAYLSCFSKLSTNYYLILLHGQKFKEQGYLL